MVWSLSPAHENKLEQSPWIAYRVRNLKFARNLNFATSKSLTLFYEKRCFVLNLVFFLVQKALTFYTCYKSLLNLFILLVFPHVANFRYVANFRFLTLPPPRHNTCNIAIECHPKSTHLFVMLLSTFPKNKKKKKQTLSKT